MAKLPDKLSSLIKDKVLLSKKEDNLVQDNSSINLKIVAENTLSFDVMARDLNVARQNVQKLVKLMGGEVKTGADDQYRTEKQREELAKTRKEEIRAEKEKKPTQIKPQEKKKSFFDKMKIGKKIFGKKPGDIKKQFSPANILKSFLKYFAIAGIIAFIYETFKETINEWASSLWETVKEMFGDFIQSIKDWFEEVVQPLIDKVKDLVTGMVEKVSNFFGDFGKWVVEKFEKIKEFFEPALSFIKNTFDKFMNVIDDIKSKLKSVVEKVLLIPGVQKLIPDSVLTFIKRALGIIPPEEAKRPAAAATKTSEQVEEEAKSARERQKQASERAATATGKEKEKAEQEERDAANEARQKELEAKNRRQQERRQKSEADARQAREQATTAPATTGAPAPTKQEQPTTAPTPSPTTTGAPAKTAEKAPSTAPAAGGATGTEAAPTITPTPAKKSGKDASAGLSGRAAEFANELPKYGITNKFAIQALVATSAKESGLNPQAKESGAEAYLKTLKGRGIEYIWKVFPQLKPGGWAAKRLGEKETGAQPATLEKIWSQGDEAFFDSVYGGLSTNPKAGDGYLYRGRGLIGITGRTVYRAVGKEVGMDLESNPDIVSQDFKTAVAAAAGYMFMTRKGKEKALSEMNSFTDFDTALKYTLRTVAGLGHKEEDFEKKGAHLHEQLRKASEFKQLAEDSASGKTQTAETGTPVQTGAGVPLSTGYGGVVTTTPTPAPAPKPTPAPTPTPAPAPGGAAAPSGPVPSLASITQIQPGVDVEGIKPELKKRVAAMAAAFQQQTGKKLIVTSGYRDNEKQKKLYDDWKAGRLNAPVVAEPMPPLGNGRGSPHTFGNAIDISSKGAQGINVLAGPRDQSTGWLEKFGLVRNVPGEDWHIQISGTAPVADNPVNPGQPIPVPTKDGGAAEVDTGKKETIKPTPTPPSSSSGSEVSKASTDVAAGQRQQQKPSTPNVVNAPVTNNTVVTQNAPASSAPKPRDTGMTLAAQRS
jgi:predicted chitinase